MRAGPSGCRELRGAISPPGRPASSTQVPWELLWRLLCQVTSRSSLAGTPLRASCITVPLYLAGTDSLRADYMLADARASARAFAKALSTRTRTHSAPQCHGLRRSRVAGSAVLFADRDCRGGRC